MQVVILAAGLGTRLGRPRPKPLTMLASGETILSRQVRKLRDVFGDDAQISAVVGFKMDLVIEHRPDIAFVYNEVYDSTNTSKSLLRALRVLGPGAVLWLNGDVVFTGAILEQVAAHMQCGQSFICVNTAAVGDEEVKYSLDGRGLVRELSKQVSGAAGEAVGINFVTERDRAELLRALEECADQDYFERGLEIAIERGSIELTTLDISRFGCIEVDVDTDLQQANVLVEGSRA